MLDKIYSSNIGKIYNIASCLLLVLICLFNTGKVYSTGIHSVESSLFKSRTRPNTNSKPNLPQRTRKIDKLMQDDYERDAKLYSDIYKKQIINEIKSSEDVLKNVCINILEHSFEYLGALISRTMTGMLLINPINIGCNNLLGTKLDDPYTSSLFGIDQGSCPKTYGHDYIEVVIPSPSRNITFNGWLIKSKNPDAKSVYILLHGWYGNMQSCLAFFNALSKNGELDSSHVLIVNLNKSEISDNTLLTNIGMRGAMDIYDAVAFAKKNLGIESISLYAQSISCLSVLLYLKMRYIFENVNGNSRLISNCGGLRGFKYDTSNNVNVSKVILESPVSNVKNIISRGLPDASKKFGWFMNQFVSLMDKRLGGHVNKMRLGHLINYARDIPVYIMQGGNDYISTKEDLYEEISKQEYPQIKTIYLFNSGKHGDLAKSKDYNATVTNILKGRSLLEAIFMLRVPTEIDKKQLIK
ncbi:conserved Plasmodium protein, unknown function [Babesia microti strain RI]|uniref:Uncharacterized protein n=1 Tax=Babesia microti (strain RI) TaxID=1133968 RepID=A0A1N6LWB5_BABMR|nr:conserved Plasmodium protein, unknown function [Babesia microti strain RI]SIO73164.1 conserved Plasmodium protein, unknown function [Babesia microti strain RI]|eukprot:XP_021337275.1 conserved Plasmodium protein, unknown function [Babesia microti strain RI]